MRTEPSNNQDVIDSRDVIARIEELTEERDNLQEQVTDLGEELAAAEVKAAETVYPSRDVLGHWGFTECEQDCYETEAEARAAAVAASDDVSDARDALTEARAALAEWTEDYGAELKSLEALQDQAEGYTDWQDGATLIRDTYFEDYARELAEDIGAIKDDVAWPCTCIDWERAAGELQQDYTCVDFDGVEYWIRA